MRLFLHKISLFLRCHFFLLTFGILLFPFAPIGNADDQLKDLLELRGYARIGGLLEFSVYNKEEKRSRWIPINQSIDGYRIKEYDRERNEIILEFNGREGRIPLEASRVAELKPAANPATKPAPDRPGSRSRANQPSQRGGANPSTNIPPPPPSRAPTRAEISNINRSRNQPQGGGFTSGRGQRASDQDENPSSGKNPPGNRPDSDEGDSDDSDDSSWGSIGEPPPIPSTPPPSYNPGNN